MCGSAESMPAILTIRRTITAGRSVPSGVNNEWTTWHGMLNTPAYGNGYATAYFNTRHEIRYHGWVMTGNGKGTITGPVTGYLIDAENAYPVPIPILPTGGEGYHRRRSRGDQLPPPTGAPDHLCPENNEQFLLMEFYGTIAGGSGPQFLRDKHVTDAIRLDGGGSCQMIYDDELVNRPYSPKPHESEDSSV